LYIHISLSAWHIAVFHFGFLLFFGSRNILDVCIREWCVCEMCVYEREKGVCGTDWQQKRTRLNNTKVIMYNQTDGYAPVGLVSIEKLFSELCAIIGCELRNFNWPSCCILYISWKLVMTMQVFFILLFFLTTIL